MRGVCVLSGLGLLSGLWAAMPGAAAAQEAVVYVYDVHGRVVRLTHCGTVNDARETTYAYDLADNRTGRERDATGTCPLPLVALDDDQSGEDHAATADGRPGGGGDIPDPEPGGGGRSPGPAAGPADPLFDR